jgi:hypothetical protein
MNINMNIKTLLCAVSCIYFAPVCMAQEKNKDLGEQDVPVIYLFDGEHTSFAYGRVIASGKIAPGLTGEGIYELRGDTAIYLVSHPERQDEPVCKIIDDFMTGNNTKQNFYTGEYASYII